MSKRPLTGGSALGGEAIVARKPLGDRKRSMDDALAYALKNWIRNEALSILAEGKRSTSELAKLMGLDVKLLGNHVRQLYECGCIEIAEIKKRGNVTETFYRAVVLPYITDEAYRDMTLEERRDVIGVTTLSILTETMASYRAGTMEPDDDLCLLWDALSLDAQGRREVSEEFADSFKRMLRIKGRAAKRLADSGELGTTTIISMTGFERSRPGRPERTYAPFIEN